MCHQQFHHHDAAPADVGADACGKSPALTIPVATAGAHLGSTGPHRRPQHPLLLAHRSSAGSDHRAVMATIEATIPLLPARRRQYQPSAGVKKLSPVPCVLQPGELMGRGEDGQR